MKRAEIYGGVTVDLHDGPIRTTYGRDINGRPTAQLVIGEAGQSIGIAVSQSTPETIVLLLEAVSELRAWAALQERIKHLPEVA